DGQIAISATPSLMTASPAGLVLSNAYTVLPSHSPAVQNRVVIVSPGSTGFENRTASRLSSFGSPAASSPMAAQLVNAIVQRPWMMMPGSPTDLANSSSRWIGTLSPDAAEYRYVWSRSKVCSATATGSVLRSSSGKRCSGAVSPLPSPPVTPRKNVTEYCSLTSWPVSSRVSMRLTTVVPDRHSREAIGAARERNTAPG